MKKLSEKYNDSCIKIFDFLKLLSNGEADYKDVIELFQNNEETSKSAAHVILNKYLNTLKVFGINIEKVKNKYYLENSPYCLNFNSDDVKVISLLKSSVNILPNGKQKEYFEKFLNDIQVRMTSVAKDLLNDNNNASNLDISEYFTKYSALISKCEQYCFENQKLEVIFKHENQEYKLICNPREVNYISRRAYFCVFNHLSRQVFEIPIDSIIDIKQFPTISSSPEISTTVVYQIRNNLAKSYKLKQWESTDGKFDENGWLSIINNDENFDVLIKRLMRYDYDCRIVSPKSVKDRMLAMLDDTLKNYA